MRVSATKMSSLRMLTFPSRMRAVPAPFSSSQINWDQVETSARRSSMSAVAPASRARRSGALLRCCLTMNRGSLSARRSTLMTYCLAGTGADLQRGLKAASLWTLNPDREVAPLIMRQETSTASIWLPRYLRIKSMRMKIVFKSRFRIQIPWDAPSVEKAESAMKLTATIYLRYKSKIHLPRIISLTGIIWINKVPSKKIMMTILALWTN